MPPIDEELVESQTVGGPYKGRIYGIGTFIVILCPLPSMTGDVSARPEQVEEVVHTHIHTLNEELHKRLDK